MFFETSGWALPKSIATEKKEVISKKNKLANKANLRDTKEGQTSHDADQIQAQLASLNDQPDQVKEAPKVKKPRVRNKKRALEETESSVPETKKPKNDKPVEKQPESKKGQQKKKLQEVC